MEQPGEPWAAQVGQLDAGGPSLGAGEHDRICPKLHGSSVRSIPAS
jgi:hypothetical protein